VDFFGGLFESHSGRVVQHYVIKFVSNLWQVGVHTPVSSTNKTDRHDITEILLIVALNTIKPNQLFFFVQNMEFYLLIPENCNNLNILCEK
jgi:hypothetical protein